MIRMHVSLGRVLLLIAGSLVVSAVLAGRASADDNRVTAVFARLLVDPKVPHVPADDEPGPFPLTNVRDRMSSVSNLKQIGIAWHSFYDDHGALPAAAIRDRKGKALLSWRVALLPYLDHDLYREFRLDEPWDSDHNKKLLDRMPAVYASTARGKPLEKSKTYYQVFTGANTLFDPKKARGFGATTLGSRFGDVDDGMSNTALVVEAGEPVPWTKPDDVPYGAGRIPVLGGVYKLGYHVLLADADVKFVSRKSKPAALRALITPADGEVLNWDDLPSPRTWGWYNPR